jgi:O-antigen/teichoic acid export membrane protein
MAATLEAFFPSIRASLAFAPALVVPGLTSLVIYPLLARAMSSSQLGTYALVSGLLAVSPVVCSYWLEAAIVRYHFEAGVGLSPPALRRGTILAIIGAALLTFFAALLTTADAGVASIAASMSAVVVHFSLRVAELRARGDFARYGAFLSIRSVAGLPLAFLGGLGAGPAGALVGQHITQLALSPFVKTAAPARPVGQAISLREALTYGLPVSLMNIGAIVLSLGDRYIIRISQPLAQVAVYATAYMVLEPAFRLIPLAASAGIAPSVFNARARGHRSQANAEIFRTLGLVMAAELLLLVVAVAFAEKWTALLGPDYLGTRLLVLPLGLGLLIHAATQIIQLVYLAEEQTRALATNFGIASLANILVNLVVVPTFGIIGAAWTTTATYGLLLVLNIARLPLRPTTSA